MKLRYHKWLLPIACWAFWAGCQGGKNTSSISTTNTATDTFPNGWLGTYEGNMELFFPGHPAGSVNVKLELAPTDTLHRWIWRMTYFGQPPIGTMVKDYRLVRQSATVYGMDEGGGLVLREDLVGNTFYSNFSLGEPGKESLYFSCLRKLNANELWFEVSAVPMNPIDTVAGDIYIHPLTTTQRVLLKRK